MRAAASILTVLLLAAPANGAPQAYPSAAPAVRTTSLPALRDLARARAVHERFSSGLQAERRGDWQSAIAEFEQILSLHPVEPQSSTAHYDLGIAYANAHRLDDAAAQFRSALAGDSGFLAAMANLIAVDLLRGDLAEARAVSARLLSVAPDSARGLYSQGIVALRENDVAAARNVFSQLLRLNPQYAVAHYDLGVIEVRAQRFTSAQREFELALDLAPNYARARFALGAVLLREGRRGEARAAFERVVRDPNGDLALQNLAQAMRDAIRSP